MSKDLPQIASENGIDLPTWTALKYSVYPGVKESSIVKAYLYCKSRNIDVLKKPVHVVRLKYPVVDAYGNYKMDRNGARVEEPIDVILPGINEYRMTASATGQMAGLDEPHFGPTISLYGRQVPEWCKVTVYRLVNGTRAAFTHVEFFEEACGVFFDGKRNEHRLSPIWARRPRGQLAKCAEAGALRKAFPGEVGAVVTADEINEEMHVGVAEHADVPVHGEVSADNAGLDADSLSRLQRAMQDAQLDEATICSAYQLQDIASLSKSQFPVVMARIAEYKARRLAMAQQGGEPPSTAGSEAKKSKEANAAAENEKPSVGKKTSVHVPEQDDDEVVFQ